MTTSPTSPTMTIPTTNATASSAVEQAARGLGAMVWWSLVDTAITPDRMRAILVAEGEDPAVVPDIDQLSALKRATREWAQGRGHADRFRAEMAQVDTTTLVATIGILRREKPAADEVRWVQVDSCTFDPKTGTWDQTGTTPEATAFRATADEIRTHLDHQWIRPNVIVAGLIKAQATCLRSRGGVYYVPRQHEDALARLARIVRSIGSCHLDIVHALATLDSRQTIASSASESMKDELGDLMTRIGDWTQSARKVSSSSAETVLDELASLQSRAGLYADALSISMDDLTIAIEAARVEARRIIDGHQPTATATAKDDAADPTPTVDAPQRLIDMLRHALAPLVPNADGVLLLPQARAAELGLRATRYDHWATGQGAAAARALGYRSRLRGTGTEPGILFRPLGAQPEATENAPAADDVAPQGDLPAEPTASNSIFDGTGSVVVEPPADVPAPTESVVIPDDVDSEEALADVREQLAGMVRADLEPRWSRINGRPVPSGLSKRSLVNDLVDAAKKGHLATVLGR